MILAFSVTAASAQQTAHVFEGESQQHVRLAYLLFLPANYSAETQKAWPLILYMHGASLRGDNVERLRTVGLPHRLERDKDFPFVVVAPLCPEGEIWTDTEGLKQLIDQVVRDNRIDRKRVYLTGHSMGGRGSLYLAYKYPGQFAAVVAMSPFAPITAWAKRLGNVPLWIIHGAKDTKAPIKDSEELVHAIEQSGGHQIRFTPLPERDHFILDVYDKDEVFEWMDGKRVTGDENGDSSSYKVTSVNRQATFAEAPAWPGCPSVGRVIALR